MLSSKSLFLVSHDVVHAISVKLSETVRKIFLYSISSKGRNHEAKDADDFYSTLWGELVMRNSNAKIRVDQHHGLAKFIEQFKPIRAIKIINMDTVYATRYNCCEK